MKNLSFCPNCGGEKFTQAQFKAWVCGECGFTYFHNTAAAVAGILVFHDEILLTERKQNPGQGMLDLPGGFVDYDESLEDALTREINEELGFNVVNWDYMISYANSYEHKEVGYKTTDAFFRSDFDEKPALTVGDDVAAARWFDIQNINLEYFAFDSVRNAIRSFLDKKT